MSAATRWKKIGRVAGVCAGAAVAVTALCSPVTAMDKPRWESGKTFSSKKDCERELKRLKAKGEIKNGYCSHENPCVRAVEAESGPHNCGYYRLYEER